MSKMLHKRVINNHQREFFTISLLFITKSDNNEISHSSVGIPENCSYFIWTRIRTVKRENIVEREGRNKVQITIQARVRLAFLEEDMLFWLSSPY